MDRNNYAIFIDLENCGGKVATFKDGTGSGYRMPARVSGDWNTVVIGDPAYSSETTQFLGRVDVYSIVNGVWSAVYSEEGTEAEARLGSYVDVSSDGKLISFSSPRGDVGSPETGYVKTVLLP